MIINKVSNWKLGTSFVQLSDNGNPEDLNGRLGFVRVMQFLFIFKAKRVTLILI